jgi:hypothetical protein
MTPDAIRGEAESQSYGTGTPIANEQGHNTQGLFHSNQVAAFDYSERQAAFAAKIMNCVSRAFYAIGASPQTQEIVFERVYTTQNIGRNEIMDKPKEFIEGLKTIYGGWSGRLRVHVNQGNQA